MVCGDVEVYDALRVFSGDGPAREFEAGQQRGGNFPCICGAKASSHCNLVHCFRREVLSLDDRKGTAVSQVSKRKLASRQLNPLQVQHMKVADIIAELDSRNIEYDGTKKAQVKEELINAHHGIARPPALLFQDLCKTADELNLGSYEIVGCEPMHDLTNIVMHVITELPNCLTDPSTQKEFKRFQAGTVGARTQIKGSNARLFAVQLVKLATTFHEQNLISDNIMQLISSLEDIISICYSNFESRTPKNVLRLHNQTFIFAIMCRIVFGIPSKLTPRKFFGSHFHSITIHAAEIYRIFTLKSILTEKEERCFADLKYIAERNTNRQPGQVIDNTVLRFNSKHNSDDKVNYFQYQDTLIKKQARLLPKKSGSRISSAIILKQSNLLQAHLERIPDFMLCGKGIWWTLDNDGNIIFMDGPDDPSYHPAGPSLHHFRQWSLKQEKEMLRETWKEVAKRVESNQLSLPLKKIKVFENDGITRTVENTREPERKDITGTHRV